jgi:prolipoprotein diacylglyceryl transferase
MIHFYALGYIIGITAAILLTRRRWRKLGGNPDVVNDLALWVVPAGIIGGRIYFDITTPNDIPHVWYGVFAVWSGGLGIWGGVLVAALVGAWRLRRWGLSVGPFANAIAPGLLVAQAIGRIGNYFNNELFGKPTTLPWALEVPATGNLRPPGYTQFATFQPSFLYELIWDLALAALLIWLGNRARIKYWGLFALYVAGYSAYRIFEESIRIDSSEHFLGLRLNMYVAIIGTLSGLIWFIIVQLRPEKPAVVQTPPQPDAPDAANALDDAEPEDTVAQDTVAQDTVAQDTVAQDTVAQDTVAEDERVAEDTALEGTGPEGTAPEGTALEGTGPENTAADAKTVDVAEPEGTAAKGAAAVDAATEGGGERASDTETSTVTIEAGEPPA